MKIDEFYELEIIISLTITRLYSSENCGAICTLVMSIRIQLLGSCPKLIIFMYCTPYTRINKIHQLHFVNMSISEFRKKNVCQYFAEQMLYVIIYVVYIL